MVAHLAKNYGGDLVRNALRVNELEATEKQLGDMSRRLNDIDLVPPKDQPRPAPQAYGDTTTCGPARPGADDFADQHETDLGLPVLVAKGGRPHLRPRTAARANSADPPAPRAPPPRWWCLVGGFRRLFPTPAPWRDVGILLSTPTRSIRGPLPISLLRRPHVCPGRPSRRRLRRFLFPRPVRRHPWVVIP